jgi:predicted nucleic acid-binding protein
MKGGEPAATRVEAVLPQRPLMSWINAGEVAYKTEDREGSEGLVEIMEVLRNRVALQLPNEDICLAAASLKAKHAISFADCFAIATAIYFDAVLLTGDPEILGGDPSWPVESLL